MATKKKNMSIEERLDNAGIKKIDGIYYVPERVFFQMCDKAEEIDMQFEDFLSIRDVKRANIEKNAGKYLPFLLYLDIKDEAKNRSQKDLKKYINDVLKEHIVVV